MENELENFKRTKRFKNHWSRPAGKNGYYWYLTFQNFPGLHAITEQCQKEIDFPYFDLVPPRELHLTLDRIAYEGEIMEGQLAAVERAAVRACEHLQPIDATVGFLSGTSGAVGFAVTPRKSIQEIHDELRAATLSEFPEAPIMNRPFHPHVTIAYANTDGISAADVIAAVEKLHSTVRFDIRIKEVTLVLLERQQRTYSWRAVSRISLSDGKLTNSR